MRVSPACHASLMPVIMMISSSPHLGTQSGKCESTPHAARTRTIIDYPWRALAKGELAATTQAAALTARRAHCEQRAHCSPRSLLAALTARRAACMTAHGAHCRLAGCRKALAGSRKALAGSRIATKIHAAIIIITAKPDKCRPTTALANPSDVATSCTSYRSTSSCSPPMLPP